MTPSPETRVRGRFSDRLSEQKQHPAESSTRGRECWLDPHALSTTLHGLTSSDGYVYRTGQLPNCRQIGSYERNAVLTLQPIIQGSMKGKRGKSLSVQPTPLLDAPRRGLGPMAKGIRLPRRGL